MNKEKADNILTEDIKQFYFKNLFINTHVQCTYIYLLDMLDTCGFFSRGRGILRTLQKRKN